ncbi:MAG: hypothetical protein M3228_02765 [Actinomycetota bacterium]|nr:hypothetical protein [Actinomycetota bacterium]
MTDPEATQQDADVDVKPSADNPPAKTPGSHERVEETSTADYQTRLHEFDEAEDQSS